MGAFILPKYLLLPEQKLKMSQLDFIKQYAPKISDEAEDFMTKNNSLYGYAKLTKNAAHISKLLRHDDIDVVASAARNKNATHENIKKALDHDEPRIRKISAMHPRCTGGRY
jgi:hypothetical protein